MIKHQTVKDIVVNVAANLDRGLHLYQLLNQLLNIQNLVFDFLKLNYFFQISAFLNHNKQIGT